MMSDAQREYYGVRESVEIPMTLQTPPQCYKYDVQSTQTELPSDEFKFTLKFGVQKPSPSEQKPYAYVTAAAAIVA